MSHELAGLEADLFPVLPGLRSFAGVPGALQHDAVAFVRMRVRAAHCVRRELVDRQVEAGLRWIAFEHGGLHTELVALGRVPLELVGVEPDELARRVRAELRLP